MPPVSCRTRINLLVVALVVAVTFMASCNPEPPDTVALPVAHDRSLPTPVVNETPSPHRPATTPAVTPPMPTPAPDVSSRPAISMAYWHSMNMCERAAHRFGVPLPPGIHVDCLGPRPDVSGLAHPRTGLIEIFWRPEWTLDYGMSVLGHELGHQYDFTVMTYTDREQWKQLRGLEGMAWRGCSDCNDFYTPAGDFAEAFVLVYAPDHQRGNYSKLGGHPTRDQAEFIRSIVDRAAPEAARAPVAPGR